MLIKIIITSPISIDILKHKRELNRLVNLIVNYFLNLLLRKIMTNKKILLIVLYTPLKLFLNLINDFKCINQLSQEISWRYDKILVFPCHSMTKLAMYFSLPSLSWTCVAHVMLCTKLQKIKWLTPISWWWTLNSFKFKNNVFELYKKAF